MIKYNLLCKKCELTFDSWFASSKEYDKLKKKQLLNCLGCGSLKVEKNLMAPKLISKDSSHKNDKKDLNIRIMDSNPLAVSHTCVMYCQAQLRHVLQQIHQ